MCIYVCVCIDIHTQCIQVYNGILLSHKKDTIMPFAATRMDLEIITHSEVRKTNAVWYHLYVKSKIRHKQTYL